MAPGSKDGSVVRVVEQHVDRERGSDLAFALDRLFALEALVVVEAAGVTQRAFAVGAASPLRRRGDTTGLAEARFVGVLGRLGAMPLLLGRRGAGSDGRGGRGRSGRLSLARKLLQGALDGRHVVIGHLGDGSRLLVRAGEREHTYTHAQPRRLARAVG